MIDRKQDIPYGLPPVLAELDAELAAIQIEERASFGLELEAELRAEAARGGPLPSRPLHRLAVAASVALMLAAGAVFPVRAALVALIQRLGSQPVPSVPGRPAPLAAVLPEPELPEPAPVRAVPTERVTVPPPARTIPPRVLDLEDQQRMIRRYYPSRFQELRIGGIVNLVAWVDTLGTVGEVQVRQSSGYPEIDDAALAASPRLKFRPALREGRRVATWVQFDLVFMPDDQTLPMRPPDAGSVRADRYPSSLGQRAGSFAFPTPTQEAGALLRHALANDALVTRLGTLDGIIVGEPPSGVDPLEWREQATAALEAAIHRAPENPAPFLALARVLDKQGLHEDARVLLEKGIELAERDGTVSPRLRAELHYEVSTAARAAWRARANLGHLPASALSEESCARASPLFHRAPEGADDPIPTATLIAWNYLCPEELSRLLASRFEPDPAASAEHEAMRRSLFLAVAADPGHVGANVALLLDLAESGDDPRRLLSTARRFAYASRGHAYARLLSGVALEGIGRSEDALVELEAGLEGLPRDEAARIRDVRPVLAPGTGDLFAELDSEGQGRAEARFWAPLDPLASTPVNERLVAHLARSVYAHLRLGGGGTDAAELWIRYGAPRVVRVVGEGTELRTELWEYDQGPAFTLRRAASAKVLELTREGRAYLNDLRATRPHGYGGGGRAVDDLGARITQSRGESGDLRLEVSTRVPEALVSGDDTLVLALVQLNGSGERVAQRRVRIPPHEDITVRVTAEADARGLAVEIFNPSLARAAAVRVPIRDH